MKFNNLFTMRDLFMNPALSGVLPQFDNMNVPNVYSNAEIKRRVKKYLCGFLDGTEQEDGLQVQGKKAETMAKIRQISTTIEQFFNSVPSIGKNLRANTRLYMPYASIAQIRDMTSRDSKLEVLRLVIDNINFNEDFNSLNSVSHWDEITFARQKRKWEREVGIWQR